MKKILVVCLILVMTSIFVFSEEAFNNLSIGNMKSLLPDSQSYSISTGMMTNMNRTYTYSLLSSSFSQNLNTNWKLNYNLSYLNLNMRDNFVIGGLGLSYTSDKFRFSIYMDKAFDAKDFNNNYLTGF